MTTFGVVPYPAQKRLPKVAYAEFVVLFIGPLYSTSTFDGDHFRSRLVRKWLCRRAFNRANL